MTHVVTARCVDCRYTYCVVECPVSCFWEVKDPHMLVIDPNTCIDCEACVPACPVAAIWPDHELPEEYADWEEKNAELWEAGENFTEGADPLYQETHPGVVLVDGVFNILLGTGTD